MTHKKAVECFYENWVLKDLLLEDSATAVALAPIGAAIFDYFELLFYPWNTAVISFITTRVPWAVVFHASDYMCAKGVWCLSLSLLWCFPWPWLPLSSLSVLSLCRDLYWIQLLHMTIQWILAKFWACLSAHWWLPWNVMPGAAFHTVDTVSIRLPDYTDNCDWLALFGSLAAVLFSV